MIGAVSVSFNEVKECVMKRMIRVWMIFWASVGLATAAWAQQVPSVASSDTGCAPVATQCSITAAPQRHHSLKKAKKAQRTPLKKPSVSRHATSITGS